MLSSATAAHHALRAPAEPGAVCALPHHCYDPPVPVAATVDDRAARAALAEVAPRLTALIRSVRDPAAPAVGEWSAGEVAIHLAQAWEVLAALSAGGTDSPISEVGDLAALTTAMVQGDPVRDLSGVADRIDHSVGAYLAALPQPGRSEAPWLIEGITVPPSTFSCHLLSETLVHGDDIARSQKTRWPIAPAHAALAMTGFVLPMLGAIDPRALVDQEKARGLRACYDLRVRGGGRVFIVIDDGAVVVEPPSSRPVDCHLSGHPSALLLVFFSRRSQWPAILRGRLGAWGRRPWLGHRLRAVMRNP